MEELMKESYLYRELKEYDKVLKKGECSGLRYFSRRAMRKRYPKGGFVVVGSIGDGPTAKQGSFLWQGERKTYYTTYYSKWRYGIDGYVELGKDQCLAVVKSKAMRNVLIFLLVLICAALALFFVKQAGLREGAAIDQNAMDYTPPDGIRVETDPNHIALPGYSNIRMTADTDTAYMALWNPPNNPCYFRYVIVLEDTEEKLYESDLIPPGKAVTNITFNRTFPEGTYSILIKIESYALEDGKTALNGGQIVAELIAISVE